MYRHTEIDPSRRRAAAEYRFAVVTRVYRRLPPLGDDWWPERSRPGRRRRSE